MKEYEITEETRKELRISMFKEARELLGRGYIQEYYESAASGFIAIAEHYLRTAPRKKVK